jgi:hypothetical protein
VIWFELCALATRCTGALAVKFLVGELTVTVMVAKEAKDVDRRRQTSRGIRFIRSYSLGNEARL